MDIFDASTAAILYGRVMDCRSTALFTAAWDMFVNLTYAVIDSDRHSVIFADRKAR